MCSFCFVFSSVLFFYESWKRERERGSSIWKRDSAKSGHEKAFHLERAQKGRGPQNKKNWSGKNSFKAGTRLTFLLISAKFWHVDVEEASLFWSLVINLASPFYCLSISLSLKYFSIDILELSSKFTIFLSFLFEYPTNNILSIYYCRWLFRSLFKTITKLQNYIVILSVQN